MTTSAPTSSSRLGLSDAGIATKQLFLSDSSVARGAATRGRAKSTRLNRELSKAIPDILAFEFYPGYETAPTRKNPADNPTMSRPICEARPFVLELPEDEVSLELVAALPRQKGESRRGRLSSSLWPSVAASPPFC